MNMAGMAYSHPSPQAGGVEAWNQSHPDVKQLGHMLSSMCRATNVQEALAEVMGARWVPDG